MPTLRNTGYHQIGRDIMNDFTLTIEFDTKLLRRGMFGLYDWRIKLATIFFWIGSKIIGTGYDARFV